VNEDFHRSDRVAERVRADIADILRTQVSDPRIGMVSITRVNASRDLRNMTVFVSAFGADEAKQKETLAGLRSATPFITREVFRRLEIKVKVELSFKMDDSLQKGQEVLQKIKEALAEDEKK
jgi:ribosome-binding factor A